MHNVDNEIDTSTFMQSIYVLNLNLIAEHFLPLQIIIRSIF